MSRNFAHPLNVKGKRPKSQPKLLSHDQLFEAVKKQKKKEWKKFSSRQSKFQKNLDRIESQSGDTVERFVSYMGKQIQNLTPELRAEFSGGLNEQTKNTLQGMLDQFTTSLGSVNGFIGLSPPTMDMLINGAICGFAVYAYSKKDFFLISIAGILLIMRFPDFVLEAKDAMSRMFEQLTGKSSERGEDHVESQGSFSEKTPLAIIGGIFLGQLLNGAMYCSNIGDCVDFCHSQVRSSFGNNVYNSYEGFLNFLQLCVDGVWSLFKGESCPFKFIPGETIKIHELMRKLTDIDVKRATNEIELRELEYELTEIVDELVLNLKSLKKGSNLHSIITSCVNKYRSMLSEIRSLNKACGGNRIRPVCYLFVGPPGVGKTVFNMTVSMHFVKSLCSNYMREHYRKHPGDIYKNIHSFDQTDQYMSGYRNQLVFHFDEADPLPIVSGTASLPAKLIRLVNNMPCPLNMADLSSKGVTYFNSRILLGSSNTYSWANLPGVSDSDAFFRRVSFVSTTPDIELLKETFGDKGTEFSSFREDMHYHMKDVAGKYVNGDIDFKVYMNEAYKFVIFKVHQLSSKDSSVTENNGIRIDPYSLIQQIVEEAKKCENERDAINGIAGRMVKDCDIESVSVPQQDQVASLDSATLNKLANKLFVEGSKIGGDNTDVIESQGGSLSTISGSLVRRPRPEEAVKLTEDELHSQTRANKMKDPNICLAGCMRCADYLEARDAGDFVADVIGPEINSISPNEYILIVQNRPAIPLTKPCDPLAERLEDKIIQLHHFYSDKWVQLVDRVYEKHAGALLTEYVAKLSTVNYVALAGAFSVLIYIGKKLWGSKPRNEGDYPMKKIKEKRRTQVKVATRDVLRAEGGPDDGVFSVAHNNVYRFDVTSKVMPRWHSHMTVVRNKLALCPLHVVDTLASTLQADPEATITFRGCASFKRGVFGMKIQTIPLSNLMVPDDDGDFIWNGGAIPVGKRFDVDGESLGPDMVLINVPLLGKNIVDKMFDHTFFDSQSIAYQRESTLVTIDDNYAVHYSHPNISKVDHWEDVHCVEPNGDIKFYGNKILKYSDKTRKGYCGAPVFVKSGGTWRMCGIHVAGMTVSATGFAVHVCSDDVKEAIAWYESMNPVGSEFSILKEAPPSEIVAAKDFVISESGENMYGHCTPFKMKAPKLVTDTSIKKSPIHNLLDGPNKAPAMLKKTMVDGKLIDPMVMAQEGYGEVNMAPRSYAVDAIVDDTWQAWSKFPAYEYEKVVPSNWQTVICPKEENNYLHMRSIPRNKSAGYPHCLYTKKKGKLDFFGDSADYRFDSSSYIKLIKECEEAEERILAGERPLFVFMSFLKDERRPIAKVLAGKTRLISGGNLVYSILLRKYTMGFQDWIVRNKIKNGICIGINPYSSDWGDLAFEHDYIAGVGVEDNRMIAGDFSGFDKTLHYLWINGFKRLADYFYNDYGSKNWKIRRALIDELAWSRHVVDGWLVEWVGSNPSGNSLTAPMNSAVNIMMIKYAVVCAFLRHHKRPITKYNFVLALDYIFGDKPKIKITVYGDDNMISVVAAYKKEFSWFNPANLSHSFFENLGVKYTDESKSEMTSVALRPISQCTFLKRGFKITGCLAGHDNQYMSPLEIDTIRDSIRWMKKKGDTPISDWANNVQLMLEELSAHDRSTFMSVGTEIIRACNQLRERPSNLPVILPSREILQLKLLSRDMEY